jgi:hypothetical protein
VKKFGYGRRRKGGNGGGYIRFLGEKTKYLILSRPRFACGNYGFVWCRSIETSIGNSFGSSVDLRDYLPYLVRQNL